MIDFLMHIGTILAGFIMSGIGTVIIIAGTKILFTGINWVI